MLILVFFYFFWFAMKNVWHESCIQLRATRFCRTKCFWWIHSNTIPINKLALTLFLKIKLRKTRSKVWHHAFNQGPRLRKESVLMNNYVISHLLLLTSHYPFLKSNKTLYVSFFNYENSTHIVFGIGGWCSTWGPSECPLGCNILLR